MKKNNKIKIFILSSIIAFVSFGVTYAVWNDLTAAGGDIKVLLTNAQKLLTTLVVVSFFYIVVMFIKKPDENEKKNLAYGIIALFVFVTIWGIVSFLKNSSFGGDTITNLDTAPKTIIKAYE